MPHYADGTEAKVGDHVTGKLYNTDGIRAGTIISITPGAESCNAIVQFTEAIQGKREHIGLLPPRMVVNEPDRDGTRRPVYREVVGEYHGASGSPFVLYTCADYCATNELTKVG